MSEAESEKKDQEKQDVKVTDRRKFDTEGNLREDVPEEEESKGSEASSPKEKEGKPQESPEDAQKKDESTEEQVLPADFPTLLFSLASSAQSALGIAPNPMTGKLEKNLLQAKHAIDLIGMLEEKTKGNLTQEEDQLLQALLYDLRLRYIEEKKGEAK